MSELPFTHFLKAELSRLSEQGLLRTPGQTESERYAADKLNLCSNDYLGYAREAWPQHPGDPSFAPVQCPSGAGASRLISGDHPIHRQSEQAIAEWLGMESALLFSSGYAANLGTIAALARPGDSILSDSLNHASIVDGCRLSGAQIQVIPHLDIEAYERALMAMAGANTGRRWVITESYFSMDGDIPNLRRLRGLCDAHAAILMVDEAHALGVFGERGAGLCAEAGIRPDILVGTLGKALGLQGAFVAGSALLRSYLWNRARSFVFSTGISPFFAQAIVPRLQRVALDDAGRERLHGFSGLLRAHLLRLGAGAELGTRRGPILPWVVGDAHRAMALSQELLDRGLWVQAIRPPTVAPNTARLRLSVSASLTERDVHFACAQLTACFARLPA